MSEQSPEIKLLFHKYLNSSCSTEELDKLLQFFNLENQDQLEELISNQFAQVIPDSVNAKEANIIVHHVHTSVMENIRGGASKPIRRLLKPVLALVSILFIVLGISLYLQSVKSHKTEVYDLVSMFGNDVSPRDKNAYITFSNGKQLTLDSDKEGLITENGTFKYANGEELDTYEVDYATVSTPIGCTYAVTLPDGSKAWLNAQSSIKYPITFSGKERAVEVTGEIYLEINPDARKPFLVHSNNQRIEVLGTAFNVQSDGDRSITTLVHGKVALTNSKDGNSYLLSPGDQAKLIGLKMTVTKVDTYDYVAWKDGIIFNRNASLKETCTELERWYDVKFFFPKGFNNTEKGLNSINRTEMLSSVLTALKNTYEVDFEIKGKEVFVR